MSRTHSQVIYNRLNHLPTPEEQKYQLGPAIVVSPTTTPANVNIVDSLVESANTSGQKPIDHIISNSADGKLVSHDQLYTKQVRNRWTGEIIATYERVYQWSKRSITYLTRAILTVGGTTYPLDPRVGNVNGRPSDTSDGTGPVNRSTTVHFPFDVEVYDPMNAGDMLGPDIDYTVQFINWDGTVISVQTVKPGGTAVPPPPPLRPGNTFISWNEDFVNVQRDMIIRPIYSNDELSVIWVNWDGAVLKSEKVKFSQSGTPPADPTRIGHSFAGWDIDYNFIAADTTITAQFIPNMYTVTFLDWNAIIISSQQVPYGGAPKLVIDPIREHYDFLGWDRDITIITGDIVVKATYQLSKFFVSYIDSIASSVIKTEEVAYGSPGTPPSWPWTDDPYYDGYTFLGWDSNLDSITGHITVESVFQRKQITVTVIDGMTDNVITTYRIPYGGNFSPVEIPDYTDIGMEFNGWEAVGGDEMIGMIKDTTIIAKYIRLWLTISFLAMNGALKSPPEIYDEYRVQFGNSCRDEVLMISQMPNEERTLYVENWYYVNRETGMMEVLTEDTKLYYDIIAYPRFTPFPSD